MTTESLIYSIFYILIAACVVYPPAEFISSGMTIDTLFFRLLGSENESFVSYHIRRTTLTLIIYSLLPVFYIFFLSLVNNDERTYFLWTTETSYLWRIFTTATFVLPLSCMYQILTWFHYDWVSHPVVYNLMKFCNNNSDWYTIASDINTEFRRIDKISIQSNAVTKIIATENWILKVSPLSVSLAHQSDVTLVVVESDNHNLSISGGGETQFINIEVKSSRPNVAPFSIRLNTNDYKDLEDIVGKRRINVLPQVKFHKNITDKFIDAFKAEIQKNERYETIQELDNCKLCLQSIANVKLQKLCVDLEGVDSCKNCYCRPMCCQDCLARWFATRQDKDNMTNWLSAKCTCPMCRASFCILDVCLIDEPIPAAQTE